MIPMRVIIVLWAVIGGALCSSANAELARTLYIDEDLFSGIANDADYTGGLAVTFADDLVMGAGGVPRWIEQLDRMLGLHSPQHRYEIEVGAAAFTPQDIADFQVVRGDRPYAGIVYASATLIQAQGPSFSATTTVTAGILGSAFIPRVQRRVHRAMGSIQPRGWHHQISDGGEGTLRLSHELKWARPVADLGGMQGQWLYRAGAGIGFVTDVSVGVAARIGQFSSARWDIHSSPTGLSDRSMFDRSDQRARFLYVTMSARVPLYNAFLQGQFRDSEVTMSARQRRYLVPDASLGFVLGLPKGRDLHYFLRAQRSDARLERRSETFVYAGVALSW